MNNFSFWLDLPYSPKAPLLEDVQVDVAIVGAGITGVSTAYHCAKQGLKTILIEKDTVAFGSAGKNGGMIVEGTELDFATALPDELNRQAWLDTIKSREYTVSLIEDHKIDCDLTQPGSIYAARTETEIAAVRKEYQARQEHSIPCQLIEPGVQLRPSPFNVLLYNPADNVIHPVKFVRGFARAAESYGAIIYEQTPAITISQNTVTTPKATITAGKVVVATETGNLEQTECVVENMTSFITEPLSDLAMEKIDWRMGSMMWSGGANYSSVRKVGNRLLMMKGLSPDQDREEHLRSLVLVFFPTLKEGSVTFSHIWKCAMLMPGRNRPFVGERRGYYEIFGQGGNGLTNGIMMGKIMADFFAGVDIPAPYRF
jgi:gamma-glutamylputrescine oxidase